MAARIDVDLQLGVADGRRSFALSATFASDAGFVALYGPSGSGKTLTLQAMAGLLRPAAGHVRVAGRTLFDAATGVDLPSPSSMGRHRFDPITRLEHARGSSKGS